MFNLAVIPVSITLLNYQYNISKVSSFAVLFFLNAFFQTV